MSRRLSIVSTMIVFAFISAAASGCSSVSNPIVASHAGATGIQKTPESLGSWTHKASMPKARAALAAGALNGLLYAVGGKGTPLGLSNTVYAYDPTADAWTTKASMPTAREYLAAGVVNGRLYAVGGDAVTFFFNTVEAYDPTTNTWTTKASMPTARSGLGAGVVNGILYAVGGCCNSSGFLNTVEAYDPATDTWTTKASMPTARWELAVGVVNGILYAVGGYGNPGYLNTVEAYDPATDTWTTKASMPTARGALAVSALGRKLYAVGGENGAGNPVSLLRELPCCCCATVEAYDPATNTWTTKASMPSFRTSLAAGVVGRRLYAVGGNVGGYSRGLLLYNPR